MNKSHLEIPSTLNDDAVCIGFIDSFKEIQRQSIAIAQRFGATPIMPEDKLVALRVLYLDIVARFEARREVPGVAGELIDNLDFELVLFASAAVDFDSVIKMIARYSRGQNKMLSCDKVVKLIRSDSGLMEHRDDLTAYVLSIPVSKAMDEEEVKKDYEAFKANVESAALGSIALKHQLEKTMVQEFFEDTIYRLAIDAYKLSDLFADFDLGWKARVAKELGLMADLIPLLKARKPKGITGLCFYE